MFTVKSYVFPQSLEEAWELLSRDPRNSAVLGGCCWLKMGRRRIRTAIDLSKLGLDKIEVRGGWVEIGAMVTLRQMETSPLLTGRFGGILSRCVADIVGVPFRNTATVGGSVYSRFGFSDVTCALLALDATVVLCHGGEVPLEQFLEGPARVDDILLGVRIRDDGRTAAYETVRRSSTDLPVLAVAASRLGECWRVSVGARPGRAIRAVEAERLLEAGAGSAQAGEAAAALSFGTNQRGSAQYRRELARVLVRRAADRCMERGEQA